MWRSRYTSESHSTSRDSTHPSNIPNFSFLLPSSNFNQPLANIFWAFIFHQTLCCTSYLNPIIERSGYVVCGCDLQLAKIFSLILEPHFSMGLIPIHKTKSATHQPIDKFRHCWVVDGELRVFLLHVVICDILKPVQSMSMSGSSSCGRKMLFVPVACRRSWLILDR